MLRDKKNLRIRYLTENKQLVIKKAIFIKEMMI